MFIIDINSHLIHLSTLYISFSLYTCNYKFSCKIIFTLNSPGGNITGNDNIFHRFEEKRLHDLHKTPLQVGGLNIYGKKIEEIISLKFMKIHVSFTFNANCFFNVYLHIDNPVQCRLIWHIQGKNRGKEQLLPFYNSVNFLLDIEQNGHTFCKDKRLYILRVLFSTFIDLEGYDSSNFTCIFHRAMSC